MAPDADTPPPHSNVPTFRLSYDENKRPGIPSNAGRELGNRCAHTHTHTQITNSLTDAFLHVFLPEWRSPRSTWLLSGSSPSPPHRNGLFSWWVNPSIFSVGQNSFQSNLLKAAPHPPTCYSQQYWKQQASDHRLSGPKHPDHLALFCGDSWQPLHPGVWLLGQELSRVLLRDR